MAWQAKAMTYEHFNKQGFLADSPDLTITLNRSDVRDHARH